MCSRGAATLLRRGCRILAAGDAGGVSRCHAESSWLERRGTSARRIILLLLWGLAALNVCDVLLTLGGISLGLFEEGNSLMKWLLSIDTLLAVTVKAAVVGIGSLLMWRLRDRRFVFWSVVALTGGYGTLVLYETLLFAGF